MTTEQIVEDVKALLNASKAETESIHLNMQKKSDSEAAITG